MSECEICGVIHGQNGNWHDTPVRVMATCFPKSGTNLLIQILGRAHHIQVPSQIIYRGLEVSGTAMVPNVTREMVLEDLRTYKGIGFGHVPFSRDFWEATHHQKTLPIVLIRDPRDAIVSHAHYVKTKPDVQMNFVTGNGIPLSESTDPISDLIILSRQRWESFMGWFRGPTMAIKFEDLISDPIKQANRISVALGNSASELGMGSPEGMIGRIDSSKSPTFRKGKPGEWRREFRTKHRTLFAREMSDIMEILNYEL